MSKSKRPLLDTNVIIERRISDTLLPKIVLSSVVLYELIATTIDDSTLKIYTNWKIALASANQLLTPTANDWFEGSKIIRNLLRGQKSQTQGKTKKITSAQQRKTML